MSAGTNGNHQKMKRYLTVLILAIVVLGLGGCSSSKTKPVDVEEPVEQRTPFLVKDQEFVRIYFATTDMKNLLPITLSVKPTDDVAEIAVQKLLAGPENDFSSPTIPEGTKLNALFLEGRTGFVDLTAEINQLKPENAQMAVDALLLTLTEFNEVDKVQIMIDGKIEQDLAGVAIDQPLPRPGEVNFAGGEGDSRIEVYFGDQNAMYLVPVTYAVGSEDLLLAALQKLLAGPPTDSGLFRTIWPGTKVIDFSLENGIAAVNFSQQALGYGGGTAAETIFINSVVWTLTGLDQVDAVQFLFQGEKMQYLPEGSDVSAPISGTQQINWIE